MQKQILEVCVDSIESAINASRGGADRLELCSALSEGGLTPTPSLLQIIKQQITIPIFCMVRPRCGPMLYSHLEKQLILSEAKDLKENGADGFVFGALTSEGKVDVSLCKQFLKVAAGLPCTFHRAFDLTSDPLAEMEALIALGFRRILTSGGKPSALEGVSLIQQLVDRADGRIVVMAGAGVKGSNCVDLVKSTGVVEIHASARYKRTLTCGKMGVLRMGATDDSVVHIASEDEVCSIKEQLNHYSNLNS